MRGALVLVGGLIALAAVLVLLTMPWVTPPSEAVSWRAVRFADLAGWADDDHLAALDAFRRSCTKLDTLPDDKVIGPYGTAADWRQPCALAVTVPAGDRSAARKFFEASFTPLRVRRGDEEQGLFTGYYEPELHGSRTQDARFHVPLLARPNNMLTADLGLFKDTLKGQSITGRVIGKTFVPYADRREIEADIEKGLNGNTDLVPVLWVDDPVQAFFLHVQGSGRVVLTDGTVVRVGYDAQNGRPFTPIGRVLIRNGSLAKGSVTMQAIRGWLADHPSEAQALMNEDASFIFFRELEIKDATLGPPGSQGVALTPGRSLAVDRSVHGLGVPVWLETDSPPPEALARVPKLARLMVAQDTGGAIKGPVRGDVFYGFGPAAEELAGAMQAKGRMTVLVPPAVAARVLHPPTS